MLMRLPGVILLVAVSACASGSAGAGLEPAGEHRVHHDHIIGTSLDLTVWGTDDQAARAEQAALAEIERLRRILSTWDANSEVSRLSSTPMRCSQELIDVLRAYDQWRDRSGGAYSAQLGGIIAAWKQSQQIQQLPDPANLAALAAEAARPAWMIDGENVTRLTDTKLNLDSLGKGYIISRALAAARDAAPGTQGLLLNIGGDICQWSQSGTPQSALVAIADPANLAENARPLGLVQIQNAAISTSGNYKRGYDIAGKHYSHILDPRTARPAEGVVSATVIAPDNITANALATTLCVLTPREGLALVEKTQGAAALIIAADGRQFASKGFQLLNDGESKPKEGDVAADENTWPKDFQVTLTVTLKDPATGRRAKRPYVVLWIEDENNKPVRTITLWGNERKYFKDLPTWWAFAKNQPTVVAAVSRATRPAGKYSLVWDGRDDAGKPVPQGTYKFRIESNREKGKRFQKDGTIACKAEKATGTIKESDDWAEVPLVYGPKADK